MQTLWWLPNKLLSHIHKNDFPFFELFPAHVQSKFTKSAKKSKQKFFIKKCNMGIVEEQIDETDIRKIPQIVWAESGSLTVPV